MSPPPEGTTSNPRRSLALTLSRTNSRRNRNSAAEPSSSSPSSSPSRGSSHSRSTSANMPMGSAGRNGGSTFVTREVEIPPSPEGSPPHSPSLGSGRPPSNHSLGRSSTGGASLEGSNRSVPPLPALPSSLLDALAREPPPANNSHRNGATSTRTSLSLSRVSASPVSLTPLLSNDSSRPHALPALPPHSPLGISYSPSASSSDANTKPVSKSRSKSSLGPDDLPSHDGRRSTNGRGETDGGGFFSAGEGEYAPNDGGPVPPQAKKSKWKTLAMGRTKSNEGTSSPGTAATGWAKYGGGPVSRFATTSSAPVVSEDRIFSRTTPRIVRSPSSNRIRGASGMHAPTSKANGSKWLYEAQSAVSGGGGGGGGPMTSSESVRGEQDDDEEERIVIRSPRLRSDEREGMEVESEGERRRNGQVTDDEEDEDVVSPWGGSRGEQYTHDLGVGVQDPAYESDADEGQRTETEEERGSDDEGARGAADVTIMPAHEGAGTSEPILVRRRNQLPVSPLKVENGHRKSSGPRTVPLPATAPNSPPTPRAAMGDPLRNRSRSDGDLALDPRTPEDARFGAQAHKSPLPTAQFVVAVIGPRGVGKTTVIRRALKRSPDKAVVAEEDEFGNRVTTFSSSLMISEQTRTVDVLEIDMALLKYDNREGIIWPTGLQPCDGAIICYDAQDPKALEHLAPLLQAFWTRGSGVPVLVLACKADPDVSRNVTDPIKAAEICSVYAAGIVTLDGGVQDSSKKMKHGFNWMIRAIMNHRGEERRPSSSAAGDARRGSHVESSLHDKILRAKTSSLSLHAASPDSETSEAVTFDNPFANLNAPAKNGRSGRGETLGLSVVEEAPVGSAEAAEDAQEVLVESAAPVAPILDVPASPAEPLKAEAVDRFGRAKTSALDLHFSREDMIDKFLFASVTGNDEQYVTLFLIVYRRFARPFDVLNKLIERFEFVAGRLQTDPLLSRFAQMKLCGVLATWLQVYPGDFTAPATFNLLHPFLEGLLPRGATWVAHYAIELVPLLSSVATMSDPEGSWAIPDKSLVEPEPEPLPTNHPRRPSLVPSFDSSSSMAPSQHLDSVDGNQSRLSVPTSSSMQTESASPTSNLSSEVSRTSQSNSDAGTMDSNDQKAFGSSGGSRRGTAASAGSTLLDLSNALLELPEDLVAMQITRIAWEAFTEMTPRDLMRHVLAPRDPRNPRTLLRDANSNVMQSINFVNYLADWVSTMILVQSKLKWRARLLEKFITIAYSLREQENFDSLMGVLAGLNSQPVFRLTETMETVNLKLEGDRSKMPKRLRSLNKLMATTKSFSAYRLALANSGANMIPYLGVHLQDITVVNEVKSDMRLGLVNWSKFSQMGRSAAIVLDCARLAPSVPVDRVVERCILNVSLLDKDRQYALSYQYQPRNNGTTGSRAKLRQLVANLSSTS